MAYENARHRHDNRHRINLNDDQDEAVKALARINQMQTATYLRKIIDDHLRTLSSPAAQYPDMIHERARP